MAIEKTVILNVETKEATKNVDLLTQSIFFIGPDPGSDIDPCPAPIEAYDGMSLM